METSHEKVLTKIYTVIVYKTADLDAKVSVTKQVGRLVRQTKLGFSTLASLGPLDQVIIGYSACITV